ncbi:hypothetical protein EAI_13897 [Harpegnathos saltator]|uniref:Uncharacterized protein n=1 Tax=Harpegnathos saltator TaxID=610380 RepID=E2BJU4_HARSA|nr:hypothetical protein EAI_13897 [Harpegnathos saltator]
MDITIGQQCKLCPDIHDVERQERCSLSSTKEARTARRKQQMKQQQFYEKAEASCKKLRCIDLG